MQDKVKIEILDLTEDSDEEQKFKSEPLTPTKDEKPNQWPDEDDINLAQNTFKTSTCSANMDKHPTALLLAYGIKDAVVILHDLKKEKNLPYKINEKDIFVLQTYDNDVGNLTEKKFDIKHESVEYIDCFKGEMVDESGNESDHYSVGEDTNVPTEFKQRKRKNKICGEKPVCKECVKSFSNPTKLKRHIYTVHSPKERHKATCLQCNKTYGSKYHLALHMTNVHTLKDLCYECEDCGKQFKFRSSLRKHQRTIHESSAEKELFFCDICKKGFNYKNSLEAHIIYGHFKEEKKFSCNICNRSFIKNTMLQRHKTRHSKVKPMECVHCSKTFSRKYLVREHIETCHKANKCDVDSVG